MTTGVNTRDRVAAVVRHRAFIATATSVCWRERPLTENLRDDQKRHELARLQSVDAKDALTPSVWQS